MPFQQVRNVIGRIRSIHHELQRCYEQSSELQSDERLSLLLECMGRHERNLDSCLGKFHGESREEVLDAWIQYVPDENVRRAIEDAEFRPDMTADEVIGTAVKLDRSLIDLYRALATSLNAPRLRELFEDLLQMEEAKGKTNSVRVAELLEQRR